MLSCSIPQMAPCSLSHLLIARHIAARVTLQITKITSIPAQIPLTPSISLRVRNKGLAMAHKTHSDHAGAPLHPSLPSSNLPGMVPPAPRYPQRSLLSFQSLFRCHLLEQGPSSPLLKTVPLPWNFLAPDPAVCFSKAFSHSKYIIYPVFILEYKLHEGGDFYPFLTVPPVFGTY